jgi:RNA polymerase sigma-70 factor (ECF subfamily)
VTDTPLSDHELMNACARGEMGAFAELVRRHKDFITNYLYRYTGDFRTAEDLAQETFLRVFRKIPDYNASAKFTTWLYTIATNLAKDEFKRRARHPAVRLEVQPPGAGTSQIVTLAPPADGPAPEDASAQEEMRSLVHEALDALDPETKEILVLGEVQGLAYDEIAGILGVPVGTVKSRISRARLAFKDQFQQRHPGASAP